MESSPSASQNPAELSSPSLRDLASHGALPTPAQMLQLRQCLSDSGVLDRNSTAPLSWDVLPRNLDRRDHRARVAMCVREGGRAICHLTVGPGLGDLWKRTQDFAQACPSIACRPFFFASIDGLDFLAVEFFEGHSLEAWVSSGRMSPQVALAHAIELFKGLESTLENSSADAVRSELRAFFDQALESSAFGEVDGRFLRAFVFPLIEKGALSCPARSCWSNGDWVARNILIDEHGRRRLVDYEFAARTHFWQEAGWRWCTFSALPAEMLRVSSFAPDDSSSAWLESYFLVRQVVLAHENSIAPRAGLGALSWLDRLSAITARAWGEYESSYFLRPLSISERTRSLEQVAELNRVISDREARLESTQRELERLRPELEHLNDELKQVRDQADAVQRDLRGQLAVRSDKIARMQRSFSWLITSPLRACRRLFLE
ncbi:MAG: hypothetical protein BWX86_01123 [Verrucomicrobia bacterium ADurb.Bin122]|jgi:hypothetical protein|nr:MAG: hypothetical protein BWX86_01123 [Verrucomicrobia bacterium ADurb.Bin122]HOG93376.1 hypothetical protein [Opitutaceae bacterium]HQL21470.1 hypothetical protein [Opitutaceae bacterium]